MGEVATKSHRCSTCGAPLALENARAELLRCRYCGSDHRIHCPVADAEAVLQRERRVGAIAAPLVIGPLLGFAGFFALRDLLWSPYEGTPAMVVAALFVVIGLMSFRVPAALGLALVGLAGIAKPFALPITMHWGHEVHELSPLSESSLYYLVPGVIAAAIGFAFFSSLKVRELGPASRALIPSVAIIAGTALGAVGGYLYLGETATSLAKNYSGEVEGMATLAMAGCGDTLEKSLEVPLAPALAFVPNNHTNGGPGNVLIVSCDLLTASDTQDGDGDPLRVDELNQLRSRFLLGQRNAYTGARPWQIARYARAVQARYLIAYRGSAGVREAIVIDRESKKSLVISGREMRTDTLFYSALADVTGGAFPKGRGVGAQSVSATPTGNAPKAPISADYTFHSAKLNQLGTLWIYGEVRNTSSIATDKPEVLVVLKDADGREIRSEHGYAAYALEPGQTSPIAVMVSKPPAYESLSYEAVPRRLIGSTAKGLVVSENVSSATGSTLNISGKVRNSGTKPARFVQVHLLLYDGEDKLVGLRSVYAKAETLEAGSDARFLDKFYGYGETMRVEYRVSGGEGRR